MILLQEYPQEKEVESIVKTITLRLVDSTYADKENRTSVCVAKRLMNIPISCKKTPPDTDMSLSNHVPVLPSQMAEIQRYNASNCSYTFRDFTPR